MCFHSKNLTKSLNKLYITIERAREPQNTPSSLLPNYIVCLVYVFSRAYNITVIIAMIIIMVSDVGMDSSVSYLYLIRRVLLSPAQKGAKVETFIVSSATIIDSREIGVIASKK